MVTPIKFLFEGELNESYVPKRNRYTTERDTSQRYRAQLQLDMLLTDPVLNDHRIKFANNPTNAKKKDEIRVPITVEVRSDIHH